MDIGGSDIARCFHSLLVEAGFPYKECDLADRIDALLMKDLKESLCHMDQVLTMFCYQSPTVINRCVT